MEFGSVAAMIVVRCPSCQQEQRYADYMSGLPVACHHCHEKIDLPAKEPRQTPAPPAPVSPVEEKSRFHFEPPRTPPAVSALSSPPDPTKDFPPDAAATFVTPAKHRYVPDALKGQTLCLRCRAIPEFVGPFYVVHHESWFWVMGNVTEHHRRWTPQAETKLGLCSACMRRERRRFVLTKTVNALLGSVLLAVAAALAAMVFMSVGVETQPIWSVYRSRGEYPPLVYLGLCLGIIPLLVGLYGLTRGLSSPERMVQQAFRAVAKMPATGELHSLLTGVRASPGTYSGHFEALTVDQWMSLRAKYGQR
jgi:hypothetical protein